MQPSHVTQFLVDNLSYRAERQKVISNNIANVNTPGYKAKDLVFGEELQKAMSNPNDLQLVKTNAKHLPIEHKVGMMKEPNLITKQNKVEQNDGNNVSLDEEVSEMAKNNIAFEAIQSSLKKDSNWFRLMLDSSGKL